MSNDTDTAATEALAAEQAMFTETTLGGAY